MKGYLLRQFGRMIVVIIGISIVTFLLMHLTGDPLSVLLPLEATEEMRVQAAVRLGLDQPVVVQYGRWARDAISGDFGNSIFQRRPAMSVVLDRMPATVLLSLSGLLLSLVIAFPLGVVAAIRPNSKLDNTARLIAVSGQAIPSFWLGLMMIVVIGVQLGWLPVSGYGSPAHLVMPAATLAVVLAPATMRLARSGMVEALSTDYITAARSRGVSYRKVLFKHALKSALIPVITIVGVQAARLLSGTVIAETVFAWPGVGSLIVSSIGTRDFPVVQAAVFVMAIVVVVINLVADLLVAWVDPRVRLYA